MKKIRILTISVLVLPITAILSINLMARLASPREKLNIPEIYPPLEDSFVGIFESGSAEQLEKYVQSRYRDYSLDAAFLATLSRLQERNFNKAEENYRYFLSNFDAKRVYFMLESCDYGFLHKTSLDRILIDNENNYVKDVSFYAALPVSISSYGKRPRGFQQLFQVIEKGDYHIALSLLKEAQPGDTYGRCPESEVLKRNRELWTNLLIKVNDKHAITMLGVIGRVEEASMLARRVGLIQKLYYLLGVMGYSLFSLWLWRRTVKKTDCYAPAIFTLLTGLVGLLAAVDMSLQEDVGLVGLAYMGLPLFMGFVFASVLVVLYGVQKWWGFIPRKILLPEAPPTWGYFLLFPFYSFMTWWVSLSYIWFVRAFSPPFFPTLESLLSLSGRF